MFEIWKDVVDYVDIYKVSDFSRVRSLDRVNHIGRKYKGRIRKQNLDSYGYLQLVLCKNGIVETRTVHQLVCEAFLGPCPEGMEVCHGPNGILDNSLANLRYGTHTENAQDMIRDGTYRGIPVIRGDGKEFISQSEAARVSGCDQSSINKCCRGKQKTAGGYTWRYKDG